MRTKSPGDGGFTLLEILIAMTILALGGVLVISLFAAAVAMQYDSVVDRQKADILNEIVVETQQVLNAYEPEEGKPVPPPIEKRPAPQHGRDFEYEVTFDQAPHAPAGEGAIARITLIYHGNPLEPVEQVLQRTVFTKAAREKLLSYDRDKKADAAAEEESKKNDRNDSGFR